MNIFYHLTILPPKLPQAEAVSKEVAILREHFGGDTVWVNPNRRFFYAPRLLFGLHHLKGLRAQEHEVWGHHIFNPDPFPFPYLRWLKKPVVYSLTGGLSRYRPNLGYFSAMAAITVSDEQSLKHLQAWGLTNVYLVRTGIEVDRFSHKPLPLRSEIRLMVGSAPWTRSQFKTKGVEALLEAARCDSRLKLIFLWRGVLTNEMIRRIEAQGLKGQVELIDRQADVNAVLAGVHASVALATESGIIKAYPHSLLDSLAAGKPVLLNRAIGMAEYVKNVGCGVVAEYVTVDNILAAIETLRQNYGKYQTMAKAVGQRDFSIEAMLESYQALYEQAGLAV